MTGLISRLKTNIQIMDVHNTSHKPVHILTSGQRYETEVIDDIVDDVNFILNKLENGTLTETPCKLHQTMWQVSWNNHIDECRVSGLTQKADGSWKIRLTNLRYKGVFEITVDDIGKNVFWTKREAEVEVEEKRRLTNEI